MPDAPQPRSALVDRSYLVMVFLAAPHIREGLSTRADQASSIGCARASVVVVIAAPSGGQTPASES